MEDLNSSYLMTIEEIDALILSQPTDEEKFFAGILYERNDLGPTDALNFLDQSFEIKKKFGYLNLVEFEQLKQSFEFGPGPELIPKPLNAGIIPINANKRSTAISRPDHSPRIMRVRNRRPPSQRPF
jgi:hypothetical protein